MMNQKSPRWLTDEEVLMILGWLTPEGRRLPTSPLQPLSVDAVKQRTTEAKRARRGGHERRRCR